MRTSIQENHEKSTPKRRRSSPLKTGKADSNQETTTEDSDEDVQPQFLRSEIQTSDQSLSGDPLTPHSPGKAQCHLEPSRVISQDFPERSNHSETGLLSTSNPHSNEKLDPTSPSKSKPKLGKIGGKPKLEQANKPTERVYQQADNETNVSRNHSCNIAPGNETTACDVFPAGKPSSVTESPRTAPIPAQQKSPLVLRETSQERANNKRGQLKRELEHTAHGITKKKRKF